MELEKPKDRRFTEIKGTEKRDLPKVFSREDFTFLIRMFTEAGAIPISSECKGMRFEFGGKELSRTERHLFFKHADIWQQILLAKSERGTMKSDSDNLARYNEHGKNFRDTSRYAIKS